MSILITEKLSRNKSKKWYSIEWGKSKGQRIASGIFTYTKPTDQIQKNHNKEALRILETKRSQMILERQSTGTPYIPLHKLETNFLDFYSDFVKRNRSYGNRHLPCSYKAFKKFMNKDLIPASEIDETICQAFRKHLLSQYNGETPANYFARFKRVLKAAQTKGYFTVSPAEDLQAKSNKNFKVKEILTLAEYQKLMETPCLNYEVKKAFIVSLYTGLRWIEIKTLTWTMVIDNSIKLYQNKTKVFLEAPLHSLARQIMGPKKEGLIFELPTANGANKILSQWCTNSGILKHITWHCARHSFSVLLQQNGVHLATVAGMLGHTSTKYVHKTYQRYVIDQAEQALKIFPITEIDRHS